MQAILDAIRAVGVAQTREIEEQTYRQICDIQANARAKAMGVREEAQTAAIVPASRERARILHHARLEALQIVGNVRESLVDAVLDQTRGRLAAMRTNVAYSKVLLKLTQEALAELDRSQTAPGGAGLEADPRDRALLERILDDMGQNLKVSYSLNCWGGLIAKSQDDRIIVINTLEVRLERATPYLRHYLAAYFENQRADVDVGRFAESTIIP